MIRIAQVRGFASIAWFALSTIALTDTLNAAAKTLKATEESYVVSEEPSPLCGPGKLYVQIAGSGRGTLLGKYELVRQHCFDIALGTIDSGTFTFTSKKGGTLSGTYAASVIVAGPDTGLIDSTFEVTGGTGKFASATGVGLSQGIFTFSTGEAEFDHLGIIELPNDDDDNDD